MEKDSPPELLNDALQGGPAGSKLENLLSQFNSAKSRFLIFQIVGMIGAIVFAWVVLSAIFSLFNFWLIIALIIVLAGVVYFKEHKQQQREWWILQGYCANCGYNLLATPQQCPQCGRDASLDEPIWRKTRRQLEAKLLADAQGLPLTSDVPMVVAPRVVIPRPEPIDQSPIPLEPLSGKPSNSTP